MIIKDINDNPPKFAQYVTNAFSLYSVILPVIQPITLIANLYENQRGPLFFNNIGSNVMIAYDIDLGENATFMFQIDSSVEFDLFEINKYLAFDPVFNSIQPIQSVSNLNLYCLVPFDFDLFNNSLKTNFTSTGVAIKSISINVSRLSNKKKKKKTSSHNCKLLDNC